MKVISSRRLRRWTQINSLVSFRTANSCVTFGERKFPRIAQMLFEKNNRERITQIEYNDLRILREFLSVKINAKQ